MNVLLTARQRHKNAMKRLSGKLLAAGCIALLSGMMASCQDDDSGLETAPSETRRTVLIYMAAQNSLGSYNNQRSDSIEIMAAKQYIADYDRLLLFMDDAAYPRIYRIDRHNSRPQLVKKWNEDRCSTSPGFFKEVLLWTQTAYPSEEYGLVMWSHADGWLPPTNADYGETHPAQHIAPRSFGIDDGAEMGTDNGAQMAVEEMASAMQEAGMRAKYLFFDACLMQNLETAYALKDVTEYLIASPIALPAAGANYTHQVRNGLFNTNPASIAATYHADITDKNMAYLYKDFGIVISAVRTDRLQAVADALKEALPHSTAAGHFSPNMTGTLQYQAYTPRYYYRPHNYDARQALCQLLPEEQLTDVLLTLDKAVVYKTATSSFWIGPDMWTYERVDIGNYSGISLFVPQDIYTYNADICAWGDLNLRFRETAWYEAAGWAQTGW